MIFINITLTKEKVKNQKNTKDQTFIKKKKPKKITFFGFSSILLNTL